MNPKFLLLSVGLLTACSSTTTSSLMTAGRSDTGQPALHAVHDNELRELMLRMDVLMQERFMTEVQVDNERRKYTQRIADTALRLSQTVDTIVGKMPGLSLTQVEQSTFLALASKLNQQARSLNEIARHNRVDEIDGALHQINTTCVSCHALFRKTGG